MIRRDTDRRAVLRRRGGNEMPIPGFQVLMLPILRVLHDGSARSLAAIRDLVATDVGISPEERAELLPSGTQAVFDNRVAWASVYLQRATLLERPRRGHYEIAQRGLAALAEKVEQVDTGYLSQFPEFEEFRARSKTKPIASGGDSEETSDPPQTPEEALEQAFLQLNDNLAEDLLSQIKTASPTFFENLVVELLVCMGYGGSRKDAGMAIGKSGDEGIDGIIKEDRLGLGVIYVQAKRWAGTVGRPEIQKFVGALHGRHARKGVFLTSGTFSSGAREYAQNIDSNVVLVDGSELSRLMIDFDLGVSSHAQYSVKRMDSDFFDE